MAQSCSHREGAYWKEHLYFIGFARRIWYTGRLLVFVGMICCLFTFLMRGTTNLSHSRRLETKYYLLVGKVMGFEVSLYLFSADIQYTPDQIAMATPSFTKKIYTNAEAKSLTVSNNIKAYLAQHNVETMQVRVGVLVVPGTVFNNSANLSTNVITFSMDSDWDMCGFCIERWVGFPVRLSNDYSAAANSLGLGEPAHKKVVQIGERVNYGVKVLLGLGGGLGMGQSYVTGNGEHHMGRSWASEGGTRAFGPRNEDQEGLLRFLRNKYGWTYFSTVTILSFAGIKDAYDFFADKYKDKTKPELKEKLDGMDLASAARTIIGHGHENSGDEVCNMVLKLMFSVLGAYAGDAALNFLPRGGLYIAWINTDDENKGMNTVLAGADQSNWDDFLAAFNDKGRSSHITRKIPINVLRGRHGDELELETLGALLWAVRLNRALDKEEYWKYVSQFG